MSRIVSYTWVRFACKLWGEVGQFSVQINNVPAHYGFLSRWQGIDSIALKKAKGMETMYQAIMRTSLRDKTSTAEVKIVVPDINAANFLADMLPNAKIHAMDDISEAWGKPQARLCPQPCRTQTRIESADQVSCKPRRPTSGLNQYKRPTGLLYFEPRLLLPLRQNDARSTPGCKKWPC